MADTREQLIDAAARLLTTSDEEPSTRAILAAAGVAAPTLYHHFGDKKGLFDAVVAKGFEQYLARDRENRAADDPVDDLRQGWDTHVGFGIANPAFYTLMYGPRRGAGPPPSADGARRVLVDRVERVARAGRLRLPVAEAADVFDAARVGVTLTLIGGGGSDVLSERTRDAVLGAVTTDPATLPAGAAPLAVALHTALAAERGPFSDAEHSLLREWLARLARA
ncbi:MAG TPA: TetR/AcrR family transcriptional regulator [Pseudonocardiaceae bacterium]|nr:TetR/AcrR family transcriptional regulator [Pseudonocardiaceae bacterium]